LSELDRLFVITRCESSTSYTDLLASAFSQTGATQFDRGSSHDSLLVNVESQVGGGALVPASVKAGAKAGIDTHEDRIPVVAVQVTAETLARHLGSLGYVWIIEDFHKVSDETRTALADALKVFSDASVSYPRLAIIVLGASDSPSQVMATPANMTGRLAAIQLPPLNDDELGQILDKGRELLNVDLLAVRDQIIRHSVGVASVTHALAFECCRALSVLETNSTSVAVNGEALEQAKANYARTRAPEMKASFDRALRVERMQKWNNYAVILRALAQLPESGGTHSEILAQIHQSYSDYPSSNLTLYLRKLQSDDRAALVRRTSQNTFRFDRPLQHAYAMLRFNIVPTHEAAFWASDLHVSDADREATAKSLEGDSVAEEDE